MDAEFFRHVTRMPTKKRPLCSPQDRLEEVTTPGVAGKKIKAVAMLALPAPGGDEAVSKKAEQEEDVERRDPEASEEEMEAAVSPRRRLGAAEYVGLLETAAVHFSRWSNPPILSSGIAVDRPVFAG